MLASVYGLDNKLAPSIEDCDMIGELSFTFMARVYRFFTQDIQKFEEDITLSSNIEPDIVEQLGKVLRVKSGDEVVLLPQSAHGAPYFEYRYIVQNAHKKGVELSYQEKKENTNELGFMLELVLCLPNKPDKLSMILQKAVELGVSQVTLVEGDFSQMKHSLREERLHKVMAEAAEQSERPIVPQLMVSGGLKNYLRSLNGKPLFVAMERSESARLSELLNGKDGAILVGPEGGFSDEEKALIEELHVPCFTLGKRILRMETAAIVALGIAANG